MFLRESCVPAMGLGFVVVVLLNFVSLNLTHLMIAVTMYMHRHCAKLDIWYFDMPVTCLLSKLSEKSVTLQAKKKGCDVCIFNAFLCILQSCMCVV